MSERVSKFTLNRSDRKKNRRGAIVVLAAMMMATIVGLVAFAVDIGYIVLVRTELQAAADASALAAAAMLYGPAPDLQIATYSAPADHQAARLSAREYVKRNKGAQYKPGRLDGAYLQVDWNYQNDPAGDIVVGRFDNPTNLLSPLIPTVDSPNSVQVRIPFREGHLNGPLTLHFARVFNAFATEVSAAATATIDYPTLLPITTSDDHWDTLAAESATDSYSLGKGKKKVTLGGDGIPEIAIYPGEWDGLDMPPGNFGLIDIGPSGGATTIRRQIDMGPSIADLAYHGGSIDAGMELSGHTGMEATIETVFMGGSADGREYAGILGKTRYLPLYDQARGNGTNAQFRIVRFVGVRILVANLSKRPKYLVVHPVDDMKDMTSVKLTR